MSFIRRQILILIALSFGCIACQTSLPFKTDDHKLVLRPGVVAVDVLGRKSELEKNQRLAYCASRSSKIPVLNNLSSPEGYGLDRSYNPVSDAIRKAGSACLAGNQESCMNIQIGALKWARQSSIDPPGGNPDTSQYWNDTLTINMRLLNPLISALAVAESSKPMPNKDKKFVNTWLKRMIQNFEHGMRFYGHYSGGKFGTFARKAAHNHAVQSSLAAMSYGAWTGDNPSFRIGLEQWDITIGSMREDGSLPIETRRGARALFYQGRTIAALIQIAERAKLQGIDLYSRRLSSGKSLHKAVKFFIDAIREPSIVLKYAKTNYVPGPNKDYTTQYLGGSGSSTFAWIAPYISQFPNHANTQALMSMKAFDSPLSWELVQAVKKNGTSAEWIGVDARCFYASLKTRF